MKLLDLVRVVLASCLYCIVLYCIAALYCCIVLYLQQSGSKRASSLFFLLLWCLTFLQPISFLFWNFVADV